MLFSKHRDGGQLPQKSEVRSGTILAYVLIVVNALAGLLFTPYLLRALGKTEFALYNVIGSFVGILAVMEFGIGMTIQRYLADYRARKLGREHEENLLAMCFIIYGMIVAALLILGTVLYTQLDSIYKNSEVVRPEDLGRLKTMYLLMLYTTVVTFFSQGTSGMLAGIERFVFPKVTRILRVFLRVVLVVVLIGRGMQSTSIVLADAALITLVVLLESVYCFGVQKFRIKLHKFDKKLFLETFVYSFYIFIQAIVLQVNVQLGKLVLSVKSTASAVASYSVAIQFYNMFADLSGAAGSVFLPKVSRINTEANKEEGLTNLMIRVGRLQFMLLSLALIGFAALGREFIMLWAGAEYNHYEIWISVILLLATIFLPLVQTIGTSIMAAQNKQAFRAIVLAACAAFNILITYLLVPSQGAMGAAIGTGASVFIGNFVIMSIYYSKGMHLSMKRFFKETFYRLLPISIVTAVIGAGLMVLQLPFGGWLAFLCKAVGLSVVYGGLVFFFGANEWEKRLMLSPLRKLRKKTSAE